MTADEQSASARRWTPDTVTAFGRTVGTRTAIAVVAVTLLALSLRFFALGARVFHWDEGRVGYWILRYAENGIWEYHAVIHGPFLYHVNKYLFWLFGASDFVARVPVAVVSGLLPATAWLFRERLGRVEMVAVGLFFAVNPISLYYSRFMRNDVLLAAFMIYALAFYVRLFDTRKPRYLYAGTLMLALAFTTKENVLVYVVTWLGAAVLLLDHRLRLADDRAAALPGPLPDAVRGYRSARDDGQTRFGAFYREVVVPVARAVLFSRWTIHVVAGLVFFFAVVIFFYAPRSRGIPEPGLWKAFSNPGMFPAVIEEATVGSWESFVGKWGEGNQTAYIGTLESLGAVLWAGAPVLLALSVVGFVVDRFAGDRPRDLVAFAGYWGFVSVLGYPVIVENAFPWEVVHAVIPLAIPAGVGLAIFVRWGAEFVADGDAVSATLTALLVLALAGQVAAAAVDTTYLHPADRYLDDAEQNENKLLQYGQPAEGIRPTLERVRYAVNRNDGTDVLYYGSDFYVADETENDRWAAGGGWYDRLPLPWYTEQYGAEVDSTTDLNEVASNPPPVVVARAENREAVAQRLDGYRAFEHELTLWGSRTVFFIDREYLGSAGGAGGQQQRSVAPPSV
ncbi:MULTISPECIES: flippase activity-associated protein Agl23 [Halorussus]|uniref:flippase activity-associated protein Agl23 n=1 Tax=Halorussus TaxID=1070314 RepID=UPI000E20E0D5|nr:MULTISPECIES: flippase activity-associated protein Agl23 [Halorussus]NHN58198.1 TIGR03663 family protein [Halorussus sp. JP-T4]